MGRAVIDEIQRAPTLLLAIKKSIDENFHVVSFRLFKCYDHANRC